ncbi:MAG TPA: phosphatidylserine/phosphatidylglycerophosphate/cardiolipin synthase family protein [Croceibacterium sp.]
MIESEAPGEDYCDPPPFSVEAQGHALHFFPGGRERFAALLGLIDGAQRCLKVAFYIFATDESGVQVRDALVAAARRGVDVHVIVDGFGAVAGESFFAALREAGGKFCYYVPRLTRGCLIRNHQKLVVADSRTTMLGGFNVENAYFELPGAEGWSDLGFTVEGPVVERVEAWFDQLEDWVANPKAKFRAIRRKVLEWDGGHGPVRLLIGGPTGRLSSWARCVSEDLVEGSRLDMVMAYFSPSPRLSKRIRGIGRKGQARLLFPARTDHGATIRAARAYYARLLKAGVRIWEFEACRLHTKLIVLDDAVYLGSANFDARSLYINLEIVLYIEDAGLARRLTGYMEGMLPAAREITPEIHAKRATWWNRMRWWLSLLFVVAIDYTVNRRFNLIR